MANSTATTLTAQQYTDYWQKFTLCQADETLYTQQASYKKNYWSAFFYPQLADAQIALQKVPFFHSPPKHFRARIEFATHFFSAELSYAMFDPVNKQAIKIKQCPQATAPINKAMPILMQELKQHHSLAQHCKQINFRSNSQGQLLISLIYRQPITTKPSSFQRQIKRLNQQYHWDIIARSHKQQWHCQKDHLDDTLTVNDQTYTYRQDDNTFTQPNPSINQQMLQWVKNQLLSESNHNTDLLELYCGNGNFSVALADRFRRVLATEVVRKSLNLALYAKTKNATCNVQFVRLSAEETTQAINHCREFNRLKDIDLTSYRFSTILVDPPREGIDDKTLIFLQQFQRIIYVSCNPETLSKNLKSLSTTHRLQRLALFDQFPYTHHIESIAILEKR